MIVIDCKPIWIVEPAWLVASLAELGHERAAIIITREYLHSIVIVIGNEQEISMMVERQAIGAVEQAISTALLSADRELDSSITIKSIAFHPSTNQPLSQRQDRKSRDVMHKHTRNYERYSKLSTKEQQGARDNEAAATTRRRRRNEAKNSTATHSPTTTHSSLPISLSHSFIHWNP